MNGSQPVPDHDSGIGVGYRFDMIRRADETPDPADRIFNVLGGPLQVCGEDPMTGYFRTGCCETGPSDLGSHTVCAVMTDQFLAFSRSQGNDLITPRPEIRFPGLKAGNRWCLCVTRWAEAYEAGVAPPVVLKATHRGALKVVTMEALREYAVQPDADH
jgi:uncharacterized protein (DUF2237 family)